MVHEGSRLLRQFRADRGYSQRDFAELMDTYQPTVMLWETGRRTPSLEVAVRIDWATAGAVPWTAWGLEPGFVEKCGAVFKRWLRAQRTLVLGANGPTGSAGEDPIDASVS